MRKSFLIIGSVSFIFFVAATLFVTSKLKRYYKEQGLGVTSFVMEPMGELSAPALELFKYIGNLEEPVINNKKIKLLTKRLLNLPMIESGFIKKRRSTLVIGYQLRTPLFILEDYENIGIDKEGFLFPLYPFYAVQKRVKLLLGCKFQQAPLGIAIDDVKFQKVLQLYPHLSLPDESLLRLELIDVSLIDAMSLGSRKIVVHYLWNDAQVVVTFLEGQEGAVVDKVLTLVQSLNEPTSHLEIDLRIEGQAYITREIK
ncbi:hypothetical protein COB21_04100 [Candidatus Aerophobetes bacterium]|uniref:POTRA domain-containing protein n=1 Tax=Aerophobetes bacterium TaxID=2030807 RepID=A0A2A4X3T3_UNCAE|nr:MAG: hypothetical protein COB21_04100 [Candidatus Aerophobetes bacterium]